MDCPDGLKEEIAPGGEESIPEMVARLKGGGEGGGIGSTGGGGHDTAPELDCGMDRVHVVQVELIEKSRGVVQCWQDWPGCQQR